MGLQAVLCTVLVSKKIWRQFPVFAGYSVFCLFQALLCYTIRGVPILFTYVYWTCESVGLILGLAVIYEVFVKVLVPYPALHKLASAAFRWTLVLLLLASASVVYFHSPVEGSRFFAAFVVLEQATRIAEVGLVVFLFSFLRVFGLHWRQYIFGIALGLGLFTTVELVGITMRAYFGIPISPMFNAVRSLAFDCSLLIWIGYLLAPERVTSTAEMPKRAQLEQWNHAIMELINQ